MGLEIMGYDINMGCVELHCLRYRRAGVLRGYAIPLFLSLKDDAISFHL